MKKIIVIPSELDMSHSSEIWGLLRSKAFSRLRCGLLSDTMSDEDVTYLRSQFSKFCVLTDHPSEGEDYIEENEELPIKMMKRASYKLTKLEVSR